MAKILIADDEPHIRLLLEQTLVNLEDCGVEILMANNGLEALQTIIDKKPNLVFLDVMMPKMNGFEVCNVVKNELKIADIHIIMITAKGQEIDKTKGKEVGADSYITKPFDPEKIYKLTLEILNIDFSA